MNCEWTLARFDDLSTRDLYAVLQARQEVFIVEQNCVYLDADGVDELCLHLIAWAASEQIPYKQGNQDNQEPHARAVAAYLRLVPPGVKFDEPSFGRVITTSVGRGQGVGRELVRRGIEELERLYAGGRHAHIKIAAQQYLERFYGSFGFVRVEEPYLEDDIWHVDMIRPFA